MDVTSEDFTRFCEGRLEDPYPFYHRLRVEDPVHWSDRLGCWLLTRFDDNVAAHRDPRLASARVSSHMSQISGERREQLQSLGEHVSNWLGFTDPPKHTRLRKLVGRIMTPKYIAGLRDRIQEIVDELLDKTDERGEIDLMQDFAYPLPAIVGCEMLGIPAGAQDQYRSDVTDLVAFVGGAGPMLNDVADRAHKAHLSLTDFFRELAAERRINPRDDMLSELVAAMETGEIQDEKEFLGLGVFMYIAGHDTSGGMIVNGLLALLQHPEELDRLRSDPSLMDGAIEECLRYESPIQLLTRLAIDSVEMRGRQIRKGDAVMMLLGAANRDPEQFPNPDRFDIGRRENRHIAFGYGMHFCLGAPLARLEAQIAFTTIFNRYPQLRLKGDRLTWRQNMTLRAPISLPAVF